MVSGNTLVDASWLAVTNLIFNNVTSLRQTGFQMCRKIQSIKFNGVAPSELPTKVFAFCGDTGANGGFKEMDIPNEVRTIGHGAFTQCESLKTLRLKNVQMTIDDSI